VTSQKVYWTPGPAHLFPPPPRPDACTIPDAALPVFLAVLNESSRHTSGFGAGLWWPWWAPRVAVRIARPAHPNHPPPPRAAPREFERVHRRAGPAGVAAGDGQDAGTPHRLRSSASCTRARDVLTVVCCIAALACVCVHGAMRCGVHRPMLPPPPLRCRRHAPRAAPTSLMGVQSSVDAEVTRGMRGDVAKSLLDRLSSTPLSSSTPPRPLHSS
jgi:hypothetical protein